MDFNIFENQTFNELPELIIGSNFKNCTFNASSKFERCNIEESNFTKDQYFYLSNIIKCTGVENSTFDKSNNITEDDIKEMEKIREEKVEEEKIEEVEEKKTSKKKSK